MKICRNKKFLALMLLVAVLLTACNNNNESKVVNESKEVPIEEKVETPIEESEKPSEKEPEEAVEETNEEDLEDEEKALSAYLPLEVGNSWEYQGEGMEYATFTREVLYKEGSKAQIKEDNSGTITAKVFEITDDAITSVFTQSESYDDENFLEFENNEEVVILKSPIQVGTKWETKEGTKEIVEIDASLDTPAGEFNDLVKVQTKYEDNISYEYYKEGIGLVRREFFSDGVEITSTLKQYNIK